jgi:hypothetical protein
LTIEQAVAQTNHLPFDRLSLPAEQGLWQAGANGQKVNGSLSLRLREDRLVEA